MSKLHNVVTTAHDLAALIDWYQAVGADCALDDLPQDRFEESLNALRNRKNTVLESKAGSSQEGFPSAQNTKVSPQSAGVQSRPSSNVAAHNNMRSAAASSATSGLRAPIDNARSRAAEAKDLAQLRATLEAFDGCSLKFSAKNLVFGDGNPNADIMFIGEAPGRDEDIQGLPFVGRAGQLLDKMMAAIGLDRSSAYITNILPWRPPGNRKPSLDEQEMLQPFIHRHIELVNPKLLVFLGGTAAQQLLDSKDGIMRLRGRWKTYAVGGKDLPARDIPVMSTLHPAFLLRTPAQKRAAWQDLLEVAAKLDALRST